MSAKKATANCELRINSGSVRSSQFAVRSSLFALLLSLGACDWFTDFEDQPHIEPWEPYAMGADSASVVDTDTIAFRGQPQFSVPVTGAVAPAFLVSYTPGPLQLDSMGALLTNPTPPSEASLENGRKYYQINCAVCHGVAGEGNGPATLYGMPPIPIVSASAQAYPDGYLFGIIRNGRGLMPTYNRIGEMARWDVVNYVRGLQGLLGAPVSTAPAGLPGENGATVPGYTHTGPTRPAPYLPPGERN